jgi:PAS domain-containing protein
MFSTVADVISPLLQMDLPGDLEKPSHEKSPLPLSPPQSSSSTPPVSIIPPAPQPASSPLLTASSQHSLLRPDELSHLAYASLSSLPRTGLMLISNDLSRGYVSNMARELLQGLRLSPPDEKEEEEALSGWWDDGIWVAEEVSGTSWDESDQDPSVAGDQSPSTSLRRKTSESSLRILDGDTSAMDNSGSWKRRTVASILERSLIMSRNRRKRRRSAASPEALTDGNHMPSPVPTSSPTPPTPGVFTSDGFDYSDFQVPSRKPYRIFDATFSQRIVDPLEPLLESCAQNGLEADSALGGMKAVVVGIEVDVLPSSQPLGETFVTVVDEEPTSDSPTRERLTKVMRRRVVELTGAPIRRPNGTHLGGLLMLRDVTDTRTVEKVDDPKVKEKSTIGDAYYKRILDHMPQMVFTTTPSGSWDYCNLQWFDYT